LEVARIAAERGHSVEVFEKNKRVGGQLALWAAAPSMGELGNIIRWRISELDRLGIKIHLNQAIEKAHLDNLNADEIVIATGSNDFNQRVPGEHAIQIVTPHALLRGGAVQAIKALVINEGRGQAGLAAAELLAWKGIEVEIISSDIAVGADIDPTNRTAWLMRLGEKGCHFSAAQIVVSAEGNRVTCRNVYDDRVNHREEIDLIVNWQGCRVNNSLTALSGIPSEKVHYIGDCVSPRNVEIAIGEAEELGNRL
ncbi:MAG: NAD(P)H-nitrite reductase large subunit, partial [Urechidicola sp.]